MILQRDDASRWARAPAPSFSSPASTSSGGRQLCKCSPRERLGARTMLNISPHIRRHTNKVSCTHGYYYLLFIKIMLRGPRARPC